MPPLMTLIVLGAGVFALLVVFAILARYLRLWVQSVASGAGIGLFDLVAMSFKKVNPAVIVRSKIMAVQAGLGDSTGLTSQALESHYLAGGRVPLVVQALIAAHKAKITELTFKRAAAIDLAGRNVREAVQTSVYPKVIDCPGKNSGRESLDAVAKNGIQLKVKARVTVRTNLYQLIGGATEETIIARVGEGIVSAIGSAERHTDVLENPDVISKTVLARRLDANTAFEIVSLDLADIDVGANLGARLQADQAEADTRVARANAEGRRAMAVAKEQEMIASIEESRAGLVQAEAEVPKAVAESLTSGQLGIFDYYKLRNLQADTDMRRTIAGGTATPSISIAIRGRRPMSAMAWSTIVRIAFGRVGITRGSSASWCSVTGAPAASGVAGPTRNSSSSSITTLSISGDGRGL